MKNFKSSFISLYVLVNSVISVISFTQVGGEHPLLWCGVLLTVLSVLVLTIWRRFVSFRCADERESAVTTLALVGFAIVLVGDSERGFPLLLAFIGLVGLLIYVYWATSLSHSSVQILKKGDFWPDITFQNEKAQLQGLPIGGEKKPTLLIWVHGLWCPHSAIQLREIHNLEPELREWGLNVACVTPQSESMAKTLLPNFPIRVLQDKNLEVATQLGLCLKKGVPLGLSLFGYGRDALVPALLLLDRDGKVIYIESAGNYRLPPSLKDLLDRLSVLLK